jgi:hypothetical protein
VTLKRHWYYCRKRRGEKRSHPLRSCLTCARAKTRCNKIAPRCSTCATKNLDCRYPSDSSQLSEVETQETRFESDAEVALPETPSFVELSGVIGPQCADATRAELEAQATHPLELTDVQREIFEWDFLHTSSDLHIAQRPLPCDGPQFTPSFNFAESPASADAGNTCLQHYITTNELMTYATISRPIATHSTMNVRFLRTRPKFKNGVQMTANNMARILYSYPKMLIDLNALPPFLHPKWISACGSEESLEPLANCISLLGMLGSRTRITASLFWRNVRMECDRISSNQINSNTQGLIATVQALLIYMLVRVAEGETAHNNHDAVLLATLTMVLEELRKRSQYASLAQDSLDTMCPGTNWDKWILDESRRRLSIVFRIINMLVCMSPATTCIDQPGLILAPLPARKQLWEAASEEQWLNELHRVPCIKSGYGLANSGDLIELDEYQIKSLNTPRLEDLCTSTKSSENWDEWCAGMDGFGALIMLAASLPL